MSWRTMKLLMVAAMLMPALAGSAIRIIETNGGESSEWYAAKVVIRGDGVFITPDKIFSNGF